MLSSHFRRIFPFKHGIGASSLPFGLCDVMKLLEPGEICSNRNYSPFPRLLDQIDIPFSSRQIFDRLFHDSVACDAVSDVMSQYGGVFAVQSKFSLDGPKLTSWPVSTDGLVNFAIIRIGAPKSIHVRSFSTVSDEEKHEIRSRRIRSPSTEPTPIPAPQIMHNVVTNMDTLPSQSRDFKHPFPMQEKKYERHREIFDTDAEKIVNKLRTNIHNPSEVFQFFVRHFARRTLSSAEITSLGNFGLCELLVEVITIHLNRVDILIEVLFLGSRMCRDNSTNAHRFVKQEICSLLRNTLTQHENEPNVLQSAFQFISSLCSVNKVAKAKFEELQVVKFLANRLATATNDDIRVSCLYSISNFGFKNGNSKFEFMELGVYRVIIDCLRDGPNPYVRSGCLKAITSLCHTAPVIQSEIAKHNGPQVIANILSKTPCNTVVLLSGLKAVSNLCHQNPVIQKLFAELHLPKLVLMHLMSSVHVNVIETCLDAICTLSTDNIEMKKKFIELNACSMIDGILSTKREVAMFLSCIKAMLTLCHSLNDASIQFISLNTVEKIVLFMDRLSDDSDLCSGYLAIGVICRLDTASKLPLEVQSSIVKNIADILAASQNRPMLVTAMLKCVGSLASNPSYIAEFQGYNLSGRIVDAWKRYSSNKSVVESCIKAMGCLSLFSNEFKEEFVRNGGLELMIESLAHSDIKIASAVFSNLQSFTNNKEIMQKLQEYGIVESLVSLRDSPSSDEGLKRQISVILKLF